MAASAEEEGGGPASSPSVGQFGTAASVDEATGQGWGRDYQILVLGGDPLTRTRFRVFARDLRDDFRWLLFKLRPSSPGERPRWSVPMLVRLWGGFEDVHNGEDFVVAVAVGMDGLLFVESEVKLHDRFNEDKFRRDLVGAFLVEQVVAPYRANPDGIGVERIRPPEWLVEGFDRLVVHRRGGSPSSYYRGFLERGQFLKPAEIFAVKDSRTLDPVRREIFRASASALVEALLDQPEGDESMRGFLGELAAAPDRPIEVVLRQHFPEFREMERGLEKWWALELASLAQRHSFEFLDRNETERMLDEALTLDFDSEEEKAAAPAAPTGPRKLLERLKSAASPAAARRDPFHGPVDDFESYLGRPGAKEQLSAAYDRLQVVKRDGFPLYRPVFAAYERAIVRLRKGDTKGLAAELETISEMRTKIRESLERAEDHLNHFEATRTPRRSDAFDGYFRLRRELERRPPPQRDDPITRHLDELEREFR